MYLTTPHNILSIISQYNGIHRDVLWFEMAPIRAEKKKKIKTKNIVALIWF